MSDSFWNGLWLFALGIGSLLVKQYFDRKDRAKLAARVEEVHAATNGMSKRLEQVSLAQGRAEGEATGLAQGRAEGLASGQDRHKPAT